MEKYPLLCGAAIGRDYGKVAQQLRSGKSGGGVRGLPLHSVTEITGDEWKKFRKEARSSPSWRGSPRAVSPAVQQRRQQRGRGEGKPSRRASTAATDSGWLLTEEIRSSVTRASPRQTQENARQRQATSPSLYRCSF
ncbi:hypothetical protein MTO96_019583 [Rhipicephalus appendiculatus]